MGVGDVTAVRAFSAPIVVAGLGEVPADRAMLTGPTPVKHLCRISCERVFRVGNLLEQRPQADRLQPVREYGIFWEFCSKRRNAV